MLLSKRGGKLKSFYRAPLDAFEEYSTGRADVVMVNSGFTKSVFESTFTSLDCELEILYPALKTKKFEKKIESSDRIELPEGKLVICSINRFERKKGISVALKAIQLLKKQHES